MNNEKETKNTMFKTLLISAVLLYIEFYFYHMFTNGLLKDYGYTNIIQFNLAIFVIAGLLLTFIGICLTIIIYGIFHNKKYAKKFTIMFLLWTLIFPIWSLIISKNILGNLFALIVVFGLIFIILAKDIRKIQIKTENIIIVKIRKEIDLISKKIHRFRSHKHN